MTTRFRREDARPPVADVAWIPATLAPYYSRFRVTERLLLTGHSHQAWPDVSLEGQTEAWNDAAELVDDKWTRAALKADRVRAGFARLLACTPLEIALGENTHELVVRFLSALPLEERPRLVTTDGEFHTIRRQLDRLADTGRLEVVKVSARPAATIAERLIGEIDERTAAVLASSVLFENAHIVPGLGSVLAHGRRMGAELLVDAYHQLNVVPLALDRDGLGDAFVIGGGYKYCQLGEGNCFLRVPPGREHLQPVLTGWFSEFGRLSQRAAPAIGPSKAAGPRAPRSRRATRVPYGEGPARWAGSTYDPTSHYRAARVFDFFEERRLWPDVLRAISRHQVALLAREFDALDLDPLVLQRDRKTPLEDVAGFLALRGARAGEISTWLRSRGVWTDHRGDVLRLGPAPYVDDRQLSEAMQILGEVVRAL